MIVPHSWPELEDGFAIKETLVHQCQSKPESHGSQISDSEIAGCHVAGSDSYMTSLPEFDAFEDRHHNATIRVDVR